MVLWGLSLKKSEGLLLPKYSVLDLEGGREKGTVVFTEQPVEKYYISIIKT
jgi:hypothetical protein